MSLRLYEELFIVKPDSTDEVVDPLIEQLTQLIAKDGGKVEFSEKWGTRKLAYQVGRYREGFYILLRFEANGVTIKELERRLRVNDLVIKHLTVRLDEEMKWVNKRKKKREKRAARKPQVAAMPSAPAPAAPTMPAEPSGPAPGKPNEGAAEAAPAPVSPAAPAAVPASVPTVAPEPTPAAE